MIPLPRSDGTHREGFGRGRITTRFESRTRMGLVVGSATAVDHPNRAYEAHLTAMRMELAWSEERGDREWICRRVRGLESYLSDPSLTEGLVPRCRELIARHRAGRPTP